MVLTTSRRTQVFLVASHEKNGRWLIDGILVSLVSEKHLVIKDDDGTENLIPWHAIQRITQLPK